MTQTKIFNVYFQSPSETEFIESFETAEEAIAKAHMPGIYYSQKTGNDIESCIEVTNSQTGEQVYQTLTEREMAAK